MNRPDRSELRPQPKATFEPTLTPATVEHYREHGFTWIERITSDEEIEWLREVFDFLFESKMGGFAGGYFDLARPYDSEGIDRLPQVLVPELAIPELGETAFRRNARAVAAVLLSVAPEALEVWGHMIYKPPRIGNVTPWHQDEAYWDPGLHYTALGAWLPLDDVDLENGCMCFIPGSHRQDVLPHRHINDDPAVHGLETTVDVDDSRMVAVPLPAGGATFHHSRLLHYTPPNRSNRPRRAFASEYQTTSQPSERPVDRSWWIEGQAAWEGRQPIQSANS
jgi:ectoine hydroxylase-related dioxygenase (phytanoyl-CoA dioxygenase family)